jgi:CMP-N,N'-diacetyllegionaminic acid synthase
MSYVAFVPARAGSKRVPGKNVRTLAGKPLVVWTLEAFANVAAIDRVILSTDSLEFWELACRHVDPRRLQLDLRNPEDAGDKVKIFDYLKRAHATIFAHGWTHLLMGLPTVPLRDARHVEAAIALAERHERAVFSACEYGFPVAFSFTVDNSGAWQPLLADNPMVTGNTRSQDQKPAYHPNGALYLRPIADLARPALNSLYEDAIPYLMDRESSVDIDADLDFVIAEALMRKRLDAGS